MTNICHKLPYFDFYRLSFNSQKKIDVLSEYGRFLGRPFFDLENNTEHVSNSCLL